MFQQIRRLSMIARLRGLAVMAAVAILTLLVLGQTAVALGAALMVSALLWGGIEIAARDLRSVHKPAPHPLAADAADAPLTPAGAAKPPAFHGAGKPARGPHAYRQIKPSSPVSLPVFSATATPEMTNIALQADETDGLVDANEAAAQEVKRLRMAGAI